MIRPATLTPPIYYRLWNGFVYVTAPLNCIREAIQIVLEFLLDSVFLWD